jgi:hypothetical protein
MTIPNDIDSEGKYTNESIKIVLESIEVAPGECAQLVLVPDVPMKTARLYMSPRNTNVQIEGLYWDNINLVPGQQPVQLDFFRFGLTMEVDVTPEKPIKIVFSNNDTNSVTVGASLVSAEGQED